MERALPCLQVVDTESPVVLAGILRIMSVLGKQNDYMTGTAADGAAMDGESFQETAYATQACI